jgi:hypothetical protein
MVRPYEKERHLLTFHRPSLLGITDWILPTCENSTNESDDGIAMSRYVQDSNIRSEDLLIQSKYIATRPQRDLCLFYPVDNIRIQAFKSIYRSCADLDIDHLDVYFLSQPLVNWADSLEA